MFVSSSFRSKSRSLRLVPAAVATDAIDSAGETARLAGGIGLADVPLGGRVLFILAGTAGLELPAIRSWELLLELYGGCLLFAVLLSSEWIAGRSYLPIFRIPKMQSRKYGIGSIEIDRDCISGGLVRLLTVKC